MNPIEATFDEIQRPIRECDGQTMLFEVEPDYRSYWWGMPSFEMFDSSPFKKLSVNFLTEQDYREFCKAAGLRLGPRSDTTWWPQRTNMNGEYEYHGSKTTTRYPVCIPSKGRYDCQTTGKALDVMGVDYKFFVEETEADLYREHCGESHVVSMPFHDLGKGSIPARNFIWEWAKERGHARHWVLDDNIAAFTRCTRNRRIRCRASGWFASIEDFADRYENVRLCGPHDQAFIDDSSPSVSPVIWNSRIYSCILIETASDLRWRGRYNEDTDLSIRTLKQGHCSALFSALLIDKPSTCGSRNGRPMKGGNTDNVYNTGDHRRAFAESLREQHPDCVEVVWKFNRWHHQVDYSRFKKNKPRLRPGVTPTVGPNEYGMKLVRVKP